MQAVQGATEIGDVRLVGDPVADIRDEPAEAGDLEGDLGVRPAHGRGRVGPAEQPVQRRVQVRLLGALVRPDLAGEQGVHLADPGHRGGRGERVGGERVGGGPQLLDVIPDDLVLGAEPLGECGVGGR